MAESVLFNRSLTIALAMLLHATAPAFVSIGVLYGVTRLYAVPFDTEYLMMAVLLAILTPVVLQPQLNNSLTLLARQWPAVARLVSRWVLLLAILLGIGYLTKMSAEFSRRVVLTWAVATPATLILVSWALSELLRRLMLAPSNVRSAVIAGYNQASLALADRLAKKPELCLSVAGFFDDRSVERLGLPEEANLLGGLSELASYVKEHRVEVIFIALPMRHVQRVLDLLDETRDTTASIYYVPDIFVFDLIQSRTSEISGIPVVAMCETPFFGYRGVVKRLMDIVISAVTLILLSPLLLLVALLVKLGSSGPVLFKQRRYGLDGREILVYKFRTMTVAEDGAQIRQATRDDDRVTPIGGLLRRFSIDELPQLFNVLQGSMSLVGPRPHAVAHNEEYRKLIKGYMIRHKVLPGMTGLAQVSGCRGETSRLEDMQARIEYDLDYLRRWSPMLDLKILTQTALLLMFDRKAY